MCAKTRAGTKSKKTRAGTKSKKKHSRMASNGQASGSGNGSANGNVTGVTNGAVSLADGTMQSGKRFSDWPGFVSYLGKRKRPAMLLHDFFGGGSSMALNWGWPGESADGPQPANSGKDAKTLSRLWRGKRKVKSRHSRFLTDLAEQGLPKESGRDFARHAVLLAGILPQLAAVTAESDWWHSLKHLIALSDPSRPLGKPSGPGEEEDVLVRQLLSVELPLTLARQLPEVPGCAALAEPASEFLVIEQSELLDTDGWIQAARVPDVPPILATWTRSVCLAGDLGRPFDKSSQALWEWFVRQSMRLLRGDGSWMFSPCGMAADPDLLEAALETSNDRDDHRIARFVLENRGGKPGFVESDKETSFSEWAGVGILHANWNRKSTRVGVLVEGDRMSVEIGRGRCLARLVSPPAVTCNGKPLQPVGDWELVCDHVDDDVEHLELEVELATGVTLQRQFCLSRTDQFLLFADVILGESAERLDYSQTFELASGISTVEETETREIYLRDEMKIRSLVMPLGLPEWKTEQCDSALQCSDGRIRLNQSATGCNLYCGLFFDLSPRRSKHPRTWRQLTVAQSLQAVAHDVAVAYRVRVGPDQFVVYRSLAEPDNRSFLGQNHSCEFFVGRLESDGNATEIISIEP